MKKISCAMTEVAARWSLVNVSIATHHDREAYLLGESASFALHSPQLLEDCLVNHCTKRLTKRRGGACVDVRVRSIVTFGICIVLTVLLVVRSRSPFRDEVITSHVYAARSEDSTITVVRLRQPSAARTTENGGCPLPSCWPWPDALIAITII
jgi:hypothetical protein